MVRLIVILVRVRTGGLILARSLVGAPGGHGGG
ncbi:hypothetical protein HMPREF9947_0014, partial [Propionibacterium sp. 409-HC1]